MKHMVLDVNDAANLGFVVAQTAHIESEILERRYPDVTYANDVPVDTSANPFATTVTFYSVDKVGAAKLVNGHGDDVPLANIDLNKFDNQVRMAAIGYSFSLEEVGQAQMLGMNLDNMGVDAARFAYEKFMDGATYLGIASVGLTGLYNTAGITTVAAGGAWVGRTPDQVLADLNTILNGAFSSSLGVEMPNTIKLPLAVFADIASRRIGVDSSMTILSFIKQANVLTASGRGELTIQGDHRLTTRMVVYSKDPQVLKLHVPMPLRFLPVQPRNLEYYVPGMFRFAGLDIRRPGAVRYMDGVAV